MKIAITEDEKAHSQLLESYIQSFRREEQVQMELQYFESAENFLKFILGFQLEADR